MAFLIIFLLLTGYTQNHSANQVNIKNAINQAKTFLTNQLEKNHTSLACYSTNPAYPCPINRMGQVVTFYFMVNSLKDFGISTDLKNEILFQLGLIKKNDYWGYSLNSPIDSDDTSFALKTMLMLGEKPVIPSFSEFYNKELNAYTTLTYDKDNHIDVNANIFDLFNMTQQKN